MNNIEKLLDLEVREPKESTVEISLSKLGGETVAFPITELDNKTQADILDASFTLGTNKDGKADIKTHTYAVAQMTIMAGCPIFNDRKYREHYGVRTGQQLIDKILTLDEATTLADAITGLGDAVDIMGDVESLKDEIKN